MNCKVIQQGAQNFSYESLETLSHTSVFDACKKKSDENQSSAHALSLSLVSAYHGMREGWYQHTFSLVGNCCSHPRFRKDP